jgi:hypothetical protein
MNVYVFLLCYNESVLLPHTITHYKRNIPNCIITILDNESTDNSINIAKTLGCNVETFSTNNMLDEFKQTNLKNNCWKHIKNGWIIVADMDEFLCITEEELYQELNNETTILSIQGLEMIGESNKLDLSDIQLNEITKSITSNIESKNLCFYRNDIIDMNYNLGGHKCSPEGKLKFSCTIYYNKHMYNLGLKYLINKILSRYERSENMRLNNLSIHYTNNIDKITTDYYSNLSKSTFFVFE